MKRLKKFSVLLTVVSALLWPFPHSYAQTEKEFTIYMVLWRGCEEACEGFKQYIAESGVDAPAGAVSLAWCWLRCSAALSAMPLPSVSLVYGSWRGWLPLSCRWP